MSAETGDSLFDSAVTLGLISPEIARDVVKEANRGGLSASGLLLRSGLLDANALRQLSAAGCDPQTLEAAASDTSQKQGPPPGGPADPGIEKLPRRLGRYQLISFLGRGGMGKVYKAYDPRLKRNVALKLLYRDDPHLLKRFTREARAQASIDHDRVCRVFEVDEDKGTPYIAMQLLDATPLDRLADHLSIREKALIFLQVTDGVRAAHDAGLIHRDLKPGNILVGRDSRGNYQAHVVDFGLARGGEDAALTIDGTILGTPAYMAPEQVDPSLGVIGQRTDIYALGASFYQWLTQRLPFESEHSASLFEKIRSAEPVPPRKWHSAIPRDLETIVLKCLEKNPQRRYASAKALGEDLKRFLQGDPIQARPKRLLYVLGKRVRKHPFRFTGVLVLLFALAWAGHTAWSASIRERFAQEFTAMVKDIEAEIRFIHLSRKHDIQPGIQHLRTRMDRIEEHLTRGGKLAIGPGNFALGRGYLALGQTSLAKDHLETAWENGYRQPQVAFFLSKAYQNLYNDALWQAELISDAQARQQRIDTIRRQFREPATHFMALSEGVAPGSDHYLEALLAFYESDFDRALALMDAAPNALPWQHEGLILKGDIYRARAIHRNRQGAKSEALGDLEKALSHYQQAADIAASDPAVYRAIGEVHRSRAMAGFYEPGDLTPVFHEGQAAVDLARSVQANEPKTLALAARLANLWAEYRLARTTDPTVQLDQAIGMALASLAQSDHNEDVYEVLGRALWNRARWRHEKGLDPSDVLRRALEALAQVPESLRHSGYFNTLGSAHLLMARFQESVGKPSLQALSKAIESYRNAIELAPHDANGFTNMGICLFKQATQEATPDSQAKHLLQQAIHALEQAKGIQGDQLLFRYYLGRSHLALAQLFENMAERFRHFDRAEHHFEQGLTINPNLANLHSCLGETYHLWALQAWGAGADPQPYFKAATGAYEHAVALSPEYSYGYQNLGLAFLDWARMLRQSGQNPNPTYRTSISWSEQALAARVNRESQACLVQAQMELTHQDRSAHMPENSPAGWAGLATLLESHPDFHQTWQAYGLWHLRSAMPAGEGAFPTQQIHLATEMFQCATILAPDSSRTRLLMASWLLEAILQNGSENQDTQKDLAIGRGWAIQGQFDPILRDRFHVLRLAYDFTERQKEAPDGSAPSGLWEPLARNPLLGSALRRSLNPGQMASTISN